MLQEFRRSLYRKLTSGHFNPQAMQVALIIVLINVIYYILREYGQ